MIRNDIHIDYIEPNRITIKSSKDIGDCNVKIYSWNLYKNHKRHKDKEEEVLIYDENHVILKDNINWYEPLTVIYDLLGVIIRLSKDGVILKEEKFRINTPYSVSIKKQVLFNISKDGMGDALFCTPTIKKLYETYLRKITLYTYFPELFINNPYLENVIKIETEDMELPENEFESHNIGIDKFLRPFYVKDKSFDILNLHSRQIGLDIEDEEKQLYFYPDEYIPIEEIKQPYIVINPSKTADSRTWGIENWYNLIKLLEKDIFVVALGKDMDYDKKIHIDVEIENGLNLINKTNLSQAWHIINNSDGFISHTSGLLHLAMTTDAHIYELGSNFNPTYKWLNRNGIFGYKHTHIEGDCKLFCRNNMQFYVSEHGTINSRVPEKCLLLKEEFECHPTYQQVYETIINNSVIKINSIYDINDCLFFSEENSGLDFEKNFKPAIDGRNNYEWYYSISRFVKPKSILEIGIRYGFSLCSMALACDKDVYIEGWDNIDDSYENGDINVAKRNLELIGYENNNIKFIDSHEVMEMNRDFDLVSIIDGDHSYDGALMDMNLVKNNAKFLVIDDYLFIDDVKRAVDDFILSNKNIIEYNKLFNSLRGTMLIKLKS